MKHFELDFNGLRPVFIQLGVILLLAAVLIGTSFMYRSNRLDELNRTNARLHNLIDGYRTAVTSERIIRTEYAKYQVLQAHGFVGGEPRLVWVENVRDLAKRAQLPSIQYQLAQRRAYQPDTPLDMSGFQLYASPMQLRFDLYHTGDLLTFVRALDARSGGLFDLSGCSLKRLDRESDVKLNKPNIRAQCELIWFTLQKPDLIAGDLSG